MPDRIDWGFWSGVGPGAEALGDIRGKRVLDIGSGPGHHAVHLARAHEALVDGIDLSPTQHQRALRAHGSEPGVHFVCADVVEHLRHATPYDAAYGIRTFGCIDPHHLLPALRHGLADGAPLVFSALHTGGDGQGPSNEVAPRQEFIRLRDEEPIPTLMRVLAPHLWRDLLTDHGFRVETTELLTAPDDDNPVIVQLIQARRHRVAAPPRVTSRPRTDRPPTPHAALGVGAIVFGERGLLLGRHRLGTWELPGGTVEPGESLHDAVVRELSEESGLVAQTESVALLGTLVDHVAEVVRITVGAVVTAWHGEPSDQPDEPVGDWRWWPLDALPQGLFECSAQILTAWRPDLPIDHPPARFTPYARLSRRAGSESDQGPPGLGQRLGSASGPIATR
ncbi:NUDIX domain-containing protein [Streptomyces rectiviolaceus]|uniref:NUDIX domain-containing protein n=1 Tax=Streptomyces rectiviolaceus TaxID=332591 RepID=UPI00364498AC